jgi:transcriptional regulator with XRE-family HTH domain
MKLSELLDSVGMTKGDLAEKLGVSTKTISRLKEEVTPEIITLLAEHKKPAEVSETGFKMYPAGTVIPLAKKVKDIDAYTMDEIRALLKRRGGLEADSKRERETDYEIAHSVGLRVFEFKKLIERFVREAR